MPHLLRCPNGHEWQISATAGALSGGASTPCPVCGSREKSESLPTLLVPPPPPAPEEPEPAFRVVASIGPERVELARCPNRAAAHERAKALVAELASGAWISCDDRLVRSDAVSSIEILRA